MSGTMLAMPKPWAMLAHVRQSKTIHGLAPLEPKNIWSSLIIDGSSWWLGLVDDCDAVEAASDGYAIALRLEPRHDVADQRSLFQGPDCRSAGKPSVGHAG
jgi:hypothetical protein